MTLSPGTSAQNSTTLNEMMRHSEAQQTAVLRHPCLLMFRGFVKCRTLLEAPLCSAPAHTRAIMCILYTFPGVRLAGHAA
jgi:hypothetical protein